MKLCNTCKTEKEVDEFGKRTASPDGLSPKCKQCQSEYDKGRANQPHRVEARELYAKTEAGKKAGYRAKRKWMENNTVKRAAHIIFGNALRDGKMTRPSHCQGCGDKCNPHGHHEDYSKPLDVVWLCPSCHKTVHVLREF